MLRSADITRARRLSHPPHRDDGGFTMFQTQLVTVAHNYAVTLFSTDNQAALDQLAPPARQSSFWHRQPSATPIPAAQPPQSPRPQ